MPNLFSFLPVEILAWVSASTSGLTRIATWAVCAARCRDRAEPPQFGDQLDIDLVDAGGKRRLQLAARLADAGKDDALRRHAGGEGAPQFAFRDDVGAGAEPGEQAQHGEVRVGLDGEADQRAGAGREGVAQSAR